MMLQSQEAEQEKAEKQRKTGAKGRKISEDEEQEEVPAAKGNSVFDAPVVNLAAGRQLGFTPSTAGRLTSQTHT